MAVSIIALETEHLERVHQLGSMAFGSHRPFVAERVAPSHDILGAMENGDVVGSARARPAGHYFGGQLVSGGAVGGVSVAPHRRGAGVGRQLMQALLEKMANDGHAISSLYPTTAPFYRSLGWEIAGDHESRVLPLSAIRTDRPRLEIREGIPGEFDELHAVHSAMGAASNGWLHRDTAWWERLRHNTPSGASYFHTFHSGDQLVAYIRMRSTRGDSELFTLSIDDVAAVDGAALREVGAYLGGFNMVANTVTTSLPVQHLWALTHQPQMAKAAELEPWMLRMVNAPLAIAQRGWPQGVNLSVALHLADAQLPDNAGPHVLTIHDGQGTLESGGAGTVHMDIRDMARWYSGYISASTLAFHGRLTGATPADLDALDTATAGDHPAMSEYF